MSADLANAHLAVPAPGWQDTYRSTGLTMSGYSTPVCEAREFDKFLADLNKFMWDTQQSVIHPTWKWPDGRFYFQSPRSKMSVLLEMVPSAEHPLTLGSTLDFVILLTRWSKGDPTGIFPTVGRVLLSKGGWDKEIAKGGIDCPMNPWKPDRPAGESDGGFEVA